MEKKIHSEIPTYIPWFTGSLLAPTPVNMLPGHPAIEPILVVSSTYGAYKNNWSFEKTQNILSINPFIDFQFAFSNRLGMEILASSTSNFCDGESASYFQDTHFFLGYQVSNNKKDSWVPNFRIDFHQVFPSGRYQRLAPKKNGIDSTGQGSLQSGFVLIAQKLFFPNEHQLNLELSFSYQYAIPTKVHSFNTYGGGYSTDGIASPGSTIITFFSGEYSITQNLVFAFDTQFTYQAKSTFKGDPGVDSNGNIARIGLPPLLQIGLAPTLEYNLSGRLGFLVGTWFTLAGRNSAAFLSGFGGCVYTF